MTMMAMMIDSPGRMMSVGDVSGKAEFPMNSHTHRLGCMRSNIVRPAVKAVGM